MATGTVVPMPRDYVQAAPPPDVSHAVVAFWERHVRQTGTLVVLPDGCVDLIWSSAGHLFVAGPDRRPARHELGEGDLLGGVRLQPGVAGRVLGADMSELADERVDLGSLWGKEAELLSERLAAARRAVERHHLLAAVAARRLERAGGRDAQVSAVVRQLLRFDRVETAAEEVGLSSRQLRRRFAGEVGYGPKMLQRILRFRRFVDGGTRAGPVSIARRAAELGYADESHLARDCRLLAGQTPASLVRG